MSHEGDRLMRRLYLELKNQRLYFFVPPFVLFALVPLSVLAGPQGTDPSFSQCVTLSQLFIPSFAAWWPLFVLKECHSSPVRELLVVHRSSRGELLSRMIALWALYVLLAAVVFVYFASLFGFVWYLFAAVAAQCMFMIALGYSLSLLLQNTFIPLIVNFAYSSIFMLAVLDSPLNIFTIGTFSDAGSLVKPATVAAVAIVLLLAGYQAERRLYRRSM